LTLELETKQLPQRSWVKISEIRTLAVERLGKRLGRVTPEQLALVLEGLDEIFGDCRSTVPHFRRLAFELLSTPR
jgi:mRNA interferase MazF